ncbi:DUF721 domain-containing protein [Desulfuromonas sp. AOP6]|uniref:DUF721 domain-containing protein n=1 Tax=Desulfuromonas sp. AOP6 TaxID=1566351 RepID=UPI001277434C|nr:DUF721 domain-containing protein [Desulfuromonas sp. AOP6]BCA80554.1 hypothetical protein AOP6_2341 [Desulfuromonas sp. AOP6]
MSRKTETGRSQIQLVGTLLENLFRQRGLEGKRQEYKAWLVWEEAVGPQIAARARPIRIREGVLEVRVDHPVWMQQLQLMKPKILTRLNALLGEEVINDLFLRQGAHRPPEAPPPTPEEIDWQSASLTDEDRQEIRQTVMALGDPEVRNSLEDLLTKQKKLQRAREKED